MEDEFNRMQQRAGPMGKQLTKIKRRKLRMKSMQKMIIRLTDNRKIPKKNTEDDNEEEIEDDFEW